MKRYSIYLTILVFFNAILNNGCARHDSEDCNPTPITSYVKINNGSWVQTNSVNVSIGGAVVFSPQASPGGEWQWSGPNGFFSQSREVTLTDLQPGAEGKYVATYTNVGGCSSTDTISLSVGTKVVTCYSGCNYSGISLALPLGAYNASGLQAKGLQGRSISSLKISGGYKVVLFEADNFQGASMVRIGNTTCLDDDGWGSRVSSLKVEVNTGVTPGAAPSQLTAVAISGSQVYLTWTDNSNDERQFLIEMSLNGVTFTPKVSTGPNFSSLYITGLSSSTSYYFRVRIETQSGYSDYSNTAGVITKSGSEESIDDLMAYATGFTYTSATPMGNHYQGLHVTTDQDRSYLSSPANQPPVPPGLVNSLQWSYFRVTLYPNGKPSPADINQHSIGDCNGITAMASMAYLAPDFVQSLITDNGNETFTVAMFDPQGLPVSVTVDSKFLADGSGKLGAVSAKDGSPDWATVLEKAIMKYNTIYKANENIEGIGSEHVTPLFTGVGSSFAFNSGVLSAAQLARVVRVSLANGKFISGGFNQVYPIGNVNTVTAHGYAVMISSDPAALFAMRNPWGVNPLTSGGYDNGHDGVLNIPATGVVPSTIDLRIIDPGIAGIKGVTTPYVPPAKALLEQEPPRIASTLTEGGR